MSQIKEITPENYVEGPFMIKRNGKYYFMWSEGGSLFITVVNWAKPMATTAKPGWINSSLMPMEPSSPLK